MREYRLIALDMDGTVLNDRKKIDPPTREAIHQALAAGKEVVFCTGRSHAEMKECLTDFPDMHYLCGESGALVYDIKKDCPLKAMSVPLETVRQIRDAVAGRDIMFQLMSEGRALVNRSQYRRMAEYQMSAFQEIFLQVATPVEDVFQTVLEEQCSVEKVNLFHTGPEERRVSREKLNFLDSVLTMVDSEVSSLECTSKGVNKAVGLQVLCRELGISMEQVIMVGDADNDRAALEAAGLAVAMGNANPGIKAVCQAQVADNNHNGCAEAIRRFLLGEE